MLNGVLKLLSLFCFATLCLAQDHQSAIPPGQLDPTRNVTQPQLFSSFHKPLPEHIWTREDSVAAQTGEIHYERVGIDQQIAPHYFRTAFDVQHVPPHSTQAISAGCRGRSFLRHHAGQMGIGDSVTELQEFAVAPGCWLRATVTQTYIASS